MIGGDAAAVERLYDSMPEREWARMDRHCTEFYVTLRAPRRRNLRPVNTYGYLASTRRGRQ